MTYVAYINHFMYNLKKYRLIKKTIKPSTGERRDKGAVKRFRFLERPDLRFHSDKD